METPEAPSGLPNDEAEEQPLGPPETEPDAEAPHPEDLPGLPGEGEEPPTDG